MENKIISSLVKNSEIFLRNAILSLLNDNECTYNNSDYIIPYASLQISLELIFKACVIHEKGVQSILIKPSVNIEKGYLENKLKFKNFHSVKELVYKENILPFLTKEDENLINSMQSIRNNLVHSIFNDSPIEKDELFCFVIWIIINTVNIINEDVIETHEYLSDLIGEENEKKLMGFDPYLEAMNKYATLHKSSINTCIICSLPFFSQNNRMCSKCKYEFEDNYFLLCPCCNKETLIFDYGNMNINTYTNGHCLNCDQDICVYRCQKCNTIYTLESKNYEYCCNICPF